MSLMSFRWQPSRRELRVFALLQFVFALVLLSPLVWKPHLTTFASVTIVVSGIITVIGQAVPQSIRPIYIAWMIAVFPIGWTISQIALVITFFVVLTPIGWALRLVGHDPLGRRTHNYQKTFWHPRPEPPATSRYFDQY